MTRRKPHSTKHQFLFTVGAVLVLLFVLVVVVEAQETATSTESTNILRGITFPIPELGGCTNKGSCKLYCDDPLNAEACIAFAENRGLVSGENAARARRFVQSVGSGKGPGGCANPNACRVYCEDISHFEECAAFAEEHGAKLSESDPGRKIAKYLASGGTMPGGCTSKESCRAYCEDASHVEECTAFAEKAGLAGDAANVKRLRQFTELVASGATPGGCSSKEACEAYCRDETHRDECRSFAERMGFSKPNEDERPAGPGGCDSREACEAYCTDETHRDECLAFAEEHGVLKKDGANRLREGLTRVRAGLEQAPPEVAECLRTTLGNEVLESLQSGEFTPGAEVGESIRSCFEKLGHSTSPKELFESVPSDVIACAREKLGDEFSAVESGKTSPSPEIGDVVRVCAHQLKLLRGEAPSSTGISDRPQRPLVNELPPRVAQCVRGQAVGVNVDDATLTTANMPEDLRTIFKNCMNEFRSSSTNSGEDGKPLPRIIEGSSVRPLPVGGTRPPSPAVSDIVLCLRRQFDEADVKRILAGGFPLAGPDDASVRIKTCGVERFMEESGRPTEPGAAFPKPTNVSPGQVPPRPLPVENVDADVTLPDEPQSNLGGSNQAAIVSQSPFAPILNFFFGL